VDIWCYYGVVVVRSDVPSNRGVRHECSNDVDFNSIEKWALKEARLRIYEDGIDLDYKVD